MQIEKNKVFKKSLSYINHEDIKSFFEQLLEKAPDYFYTTPASSSGKYHNYLSAGEGGLVYHTIAAVEFCNYLINLEHNKIHFSERELDLMIGSTLIHDLEKHGKDGSSHTIWEHPNCIAETVRSYKGTKILPDSELEFIAECVESHMGEWNESKRSSIQLKKPVQLHQCIVHESDYLASRKDIIVNLDNMSEIKEVPTIDTYVFDFGRHKGKSLKQVMEQDPSYIEWAKRDYGKEPLRTLLKQI